MLFMTMNGAMQYQAPTFARSGDSFDFIPRLDRIHHANMGRILNVLFPVADWFLGTRVTEMPAIPASTPENARKLARRHSRLRCSRDGSR